MWDNPRLANAAAGAFAALALALLAYAGVRVLLDSPEFLLKSIVVEGSVQRVERGEIVHALQGRLRGTFFTVDLESVRSLFEGIPWVRRAELRRVWPDSIEVRVEEQVALARWGQGKKAQLVNAQGELFHGQSDEPLPVLAGPAGTEGEVARRFIGFRDLLAPLGLEPRQVLLSPRLAWQLRLSNGLTVQLGRDTDKDRVEDRLARFASVFPQTPADVRERVDYVDLRYPNGFAVHVDERITEKPRSGPGPHRRV
ncbi:MAG TPA: cell division protein FtsQ/DivIB [Burkholderiales bacterium]|nr:cell division protein FtsQ/DivIB [Burkholderiales bacterium]